MFGNSSYSWLMRITPGIWIIVEQVFTLLLWGYISISGWVPGNPTPLRVPSSVTDPQAWDLFVTAPGMFSRIHHIVGHKISHKKFKKIEIISGIFFII